MVVREWVNSRPQKPVWPIIRGCGVRQAALAGQGAGHGDVQVLGQGGQLLGRLGQQDAAAGVDARGSWPPPASWRWRRGGGVQGGLGGHVGVVVGAVPQVLLHLTGEHVHGDVHQDGAGTAGLGQTEGAVQDVGQGLHVVHPPQRLHTGSSSLYWLPSSCIWTSWWG